MTSNTKQKSGISSEILSWAGSSILAFSQNPLCGILSYVKYSRGQRRKEPKSTICMFWNWLSFFQTEIEISEDCSKCWLCNIPWLSAADWIKTIEFILPLAMYDEVKIKYMFKAEEDNGLNKNMKIQLPDFWIALSFWK